jgi:hypothetical protein
MSGLRFEERTPQLRVAPNRTDVVCFVGFVARRAAPLPAGVRRWLDEAGWVRGAYARPADVERLLDLPVPIDSFEAFDALFAWDARDLDGRGLRGDTWLGAAVRSFFGEGGRLCYVVRAGDPAPLEQAEQPASRMARMASRLEALIPGAGAGWLAVSATDRSTWRGAGHVLGLPDASFLCIPDLPDAVAAPAEPPDPITPVPVEETFVSCTVEDPATVDDAAVRRLRAPRADAAGFAAWAGALRTLERLPAARRREIQVVASVPLATAGTAARAGGARATAEDAPLQFLLGADLLPGATQEPVPRGGVIQLTFPWLLTRGSGRLPEGIEPPEGVLAGLLAANALGRGTFRSAAGLRPRTVVGVAPVLRRDQLDRAGSPTDARSLQQRITVFGPVPRGFALLSDVTSARAEEARPASVRRLAAAIAGAARRAGEAAVFESSGQALRADLTRRLRELLLTFQREGAFHGATAEEAFSVRCDRGTMTQNDIDAGRVVCEIRFRPAAPIETITVVLALDTPVRTEAA